MRAKAVVAVGPSISLFYCTLSFFLFLTLLARRTRLLSDCASSYCTCRGRRFPTVPAGRAILFFFFSNKAKSRQGGVRASNHGLLCIHALYPSPIVYALPREALFVSSALTTVTVA